MLSSRYLHLHEALGLGPMWLLQGAKPLEPAAEETAPSVAPQPAASSAAAASPQASAAREALLKTLKHSHSAEPQTAPAAPAPASPTESATIETERAHYLSSLHGQITPAPLMIAAICPSPDDLMAGRLFSGKDGVLLDNMLAAIGLSREQSHCTGWLSATSFTPQPPAEEILAAVGRMQAELALCEARALVLLGQIFSQPEHQDAIRQVSSGTPVFLLPHPARLLRQPHLKAEAWQTLKAIRRLLAD